MVQALRLSLCGVRVLPRFIRALSRVYIKAIVRPHSKVIRQYTDTILVIIYLYDKSLYIIPDSASIGLLWHVRDVRDYERLVKISPRSIVIDVCAHVGFFHNTCL